MTSLMEIRQCFNRAEKTYDANCPIQKSVGHKIISYLSPYKIAFNNIIDLGCATGIVTKALALRYGNYEHFYALDIAPNLLVKAYRRLHKFNVKLFEGNFESFHFANTFFDLIFSNMALHWSTNLELTLFNLSSSLASKGILAFSIPLEGTFEELGPDRILPLYKREDIHTILKKNGYQILNTFDYVEVVVFPSFILAFKSIKYVGANHYRTKKDSSHLFSLRKLASHPFKLTYKIGIFIARKGV